MKPGTKIRCVDAREPGIPLTEGQLYTVKRYGRAKDMTDVEDESRASIPCVTLDEVPGFFMATRFEVAE